MNSGVQPLTIGRLAKSAKLGVETIRFYEREGLLNEPARTASGYRQFPAEHAVPSEGHRGTTRHRQQAGDWSSLPRLSRPSGG